MTAREDFETRDEAGAAAFERARARGELTSDLRSEIDIEGDDR